jgi:hypothetical protein
VSRHALVVTSISEPNSILKALAEGAQKAGWPFYLIGDAKCSVGWTQSFEALGVRAYDISAQVYSQINPHANAGLKTADAAPLSNYSRKNIGYLLAMRDGAEVIVETDDDNRPLEGFWSSRSRLWNVPYIFWDGWVNMLMQFTRTDELIWPRGFPLACLSLYSDALPIDNVPTAHTYPIQQTLIAEEPDVDAIYRLTQVSDSPEFGHGRLGLDRGWCPFNSQNTTWFREAFPLMYIPSFCKNAYRMDDIWRSFIAQRIAFENGWGILWGGVTVVQERNPHDLMKDFEQEIPGYLYNRKIVEMLKGLPIKAGTGPQMLLRNMYVCYLAMIDAGYIEKQEIAVLDAWGDDVSNLLSQSANEQLSQPVETDEKSAKNIEQQS